MGHDDFFIVNEEASHIIVSRVAANMAGRTGLDAITDKPIPFAVNSLNSLGVARIGFSAGPEGGVLQALTSVLVPEAIDGIKAEEYRDLRESHKPIRSAFKQLSAELAQLNRLAYISDGKLLKERVESVAQEFVEEYRRFRKSRHTRRFKRWVPFSIGSLLVCTSALHLPAKIAAELIGARVAVNFLDRKLRVSPDEARRESTFNMLAGLRKDIIRRAKVKELI